MAFSFRNKAKSNGGLREGGDKSSDAARLSSSQVNKMTKTYPRWLRGNVELKYLPALYQGVLGQVQLQPDISFDNAALLNHHRLKPKQTQDYMNKFTDTERARKLLSASQLPNDTLATIWAHVNQTFPGRLTNREFCLALALVAHFQRLNKETGDIGLDPEATTKVIRSDLNSNESSAKTSKKDAFDLVKSDDKPPVPILYPCQSSPRKTRCTRRLSNSNSVPNKLSSEVLLVDLGEDSSTHDARSQSDLDRNKSQTTPQSRPKLVNLIDSDDENDVNFIVDRLTDVWSQIMLAIKALFKRSFDILNVENCRNSALEALRSDRGVLFMKHLCLCYPLAHNIKYKIDELIAKQDSHSNEPYVANNSVQFDKNFAFRINDLMLSINEYWAVLINLFHESGQTNFIEVIMDSLDLTLELNPDRAHSTSQTFNLNNPERCCICLRKNYLDMIGTRSLASSETKGISNDDFNLISGQELISQDNHYYYHARCANFWLNQVDGEKLPFFKCNIIDNDVLRPDAINFQDK